MDDAHTKPADEETDRLRDARSLNMNLLQARDRLGETIIEIVAADVAVHGRAVIEKLREVNVVAYARLVSDLVQFQRLATERAPKKNPSKPQRKPREIRMRDLVKAMDERPIDVNDPLLPPKHRERWLEAMEALKPKTPWDLTPDELRAAWGDDLAAWFERQLREPGGERKVRDGADLTRTILQDVRNQFLAADRVPNGMTAAEIQVIIGKGCLERITFAQGKGWVFQLLRALGGGLYKAEVEALQKAGVDWPFAAATRRGPKRPVMWEWPRHVSGP
jgi:hypothetical protein